jgi:hypothetical protein
MALSNTLLKTTATSIYSSTGNNAIVTAYFCNFGLNPITFTVYAVPSSMQPGLSTIIYSNVSIAASDTYIWDSEKLILGDGDSIWALSSEDDVVNVTICDVEI